MSCNYARYSQIAVEQKYFELLELFKTNWEIAKVLSCFMDKSEVSIYRSLERFRFKKSKNFKCFIDAAERAIAFLEQIEIDCKALFIAKNNQLEYLATKGREIADIGVKISCPQIFYDYDCKELNLVNILHVLQEYMQCADIIITQDLNLVEEAMVESLNLKNKEIVCANQLHEICNAALHATIKKNGGAKWIAEKNAA